VPMLGDGAVSLNGVIPAAHESRDPAGRTPRLALHPMVIIRRRCYLRPMKNRRLDQDPLPTQLKHLVADLFRLDIAVPAEISDSEPLLGSGLGLDSLDALELAMCIEEEFGVVIQSREESHRAFANIASLADYIQTRTQPNSIQTRLQPNPILAQSPAVA
jgi:acyl carrier protein